MNLPVAIVTKALLMMFMLYYILKKNNFYSLFYLTILIFILLLSLVTDFENLQYIMADFRIMIKLFFFPLTVLFFCSILGEVKHTDDDIYYIFRFLFICLFIAISASLFGLGLTQYGVNKSGVSMGYAGYFVAGNELAPFALLLYSYNLFYMIYNQKPFKFIIVTFAIGFVTCLLIATKVSIAGFVIVTVFLPVAMNLFQNMVKWRKYIVKYYSILMAMAVALGTAIVIIFFELVSALFDYFLSRYNRSDSFLGGRQDWAETGLNIFKNEYSILQKLFGGGTFYQYIIEPMDGKSVEIDPIDILLSNGLLGLTFLYGFWIVVLVLIAKKAMATKDRFYGELIFIMSFFIAASFTSGHIIASSLVGFYLAIIVAYALGRTYGNKSECQIDRIK